MLRPALCPRDISGCVAYQTTLGFSNNNGPGLRSLVGHVEPATVFYS